MATRTRKAPGKTAVKKDSNGNPDIYLLRQSGKTMKEAAELAGVTFPQAHVLLYKQEVEHNPETKLNGKSKTVGKAMAKLRAEGVRWERLAARSGLSVAEVKAKVAEAEGVTPEDLKRVREAKPAGKKGKKGAPAKKSAKPKAEPEPEDEDIEDEDVEDEDDLEDEVEEDEDDIEDEDEDDLDDEDEDEDDEEEDEEPPAPPVKAAAKGKRARK